MPRKHQKPSTERSRARREMRLWSVREFHGTHTEAEWRAVLREFDSRCVRCERRGGYISKDHIIPIAQGGMDTIDNLQPLCRRCNLTKGAETTDWGDYRRKHGWSSVAPARSFSKPPKP